MRNPEKGKETTGLTPGKLSPAERKRTGKQDVVLYGNILIFVFKTLKL